MSKTDQWASSLFCFCKFDVLQPWSSWFSGCLLEDAQLLFYAIVNVCYATRELEQGWDLYLWSYRNASSHWKFSVGCICYFGLQKLVNHKVHWSFYLYIYFIFFWVVFTAEQYSGHHLCTPLLKGWYNAVPLKNWFILIVLCWQWLGMLNRWVLCFTNSCELRSNVEQLFGLNVKVVWN